MASWLLRWYSNAIDASKENGKIIISAKSSHHFLSGGGGIRITIADNGVGISDENKQKLFARFSQRRPPSGRG
jgi:signal transduction histidine kinase